MGTIRRSDALGRYYDVEIVEKQVIPIVEAEIVNGNIDIIYIEISNASGAAQPKFTLKDKQSTPRTAIFGANTGVPAEDAVTFGPRSLSHGRRVTGGLTWVSDTANALEGFIEYIKA